MQENFEKVIWCAIFYSLSIYRNCFAPIATAFYMLVLKRQYPKDKWETLKKRRRNDIIGSINATIK